MHVTISRLSRLFSSYCLCQCDTICTNICSRSVWIDLICFLLQFYFVLDSNLFFFSSFRKQRSSMLTVPLYMKVCGYLKTRSISGQTQTTSLSSLTTIRFKCNYVKNKQTLLLNLDNGEVWFERSSKLCTNLCFIYIMYVCQYVFMHSRSVNLG